MKLRIKFGLMLIFLANFFDSSTALAKKNEFVVKHSTGFLLNDKPYYFLGTNLWYGAQLGADIYKGDRERLIRELDQLKSLKVTNLRVLAISEGPSAEPWRISPATQETPGNFSEVHMRGLDFLLSEMAKRKMKAILVLSNFWPWSGGFAQYVNWFGGGAIPYPPPAKDGSWAKYQDYTSQFYLNLMARKTFQTVVKAIVTRENSITGIAYKNDPVIMAWELCNEPRGLRYPNLLTQWIDETSTLIKELDSNHLVTVGSEGLTPFAVGNDFVANHALPNIDYTTIHIWAENWGWFNPLTAEATYDSAVAKMKEYLLKHLALTETMEKPMVVEEFGLPRDLRSLLPSSFTKYRDDYYSQVFQMVFQLAKEGRSISGVNFWSWAGEGRPVEAQKFWKSGDPFTGDPPHEEQGWLGVYDTDVSTHEVIKKHSLEFISLNRKQLVH